MTTFVFCGFLARLHCFKRLLICALCQRTIFFCLSIDHARRIERIFDSLYPEYKGELAKVMVSDDPRVYGKGGLLDQFTRSDMPRVFSRELGLFPSIVSRLFRSSGSDFSRTA